MSDSIGILGRAAATTVGTTTVFTCPAGFAAKGRVIFSAVNAAVGNATLQVIVGGITIMQSGNVAVSQYIYSSNSLLSSGSLAAGPDGLTDAKTVAPFQRIYFLSPGDTVQYIIAGNAFASLQMQFVGVLVDLAD
jgi:hypothetical protein